MLGKRNQLKTLILRTGLWSAAVLILTSVHHLYGAIVYNTPWRLHVLPPAILVAAFIASMLVVLYRRFDAPAGTAAYWLAIGSIFTVPIAIIGVFEGGYNHVFKDILYYSGVSGAAMNRLFPPPTYEMPNNLFFEATGVLTFFIALLTAHSVYRLILFRRRIGGKNQSMLQNAA